MDYEKYIEKDILEKYEFYNYGHALEILCDAFRRNGRNCRTACGVCG